MKHQKDLFDLFRDNQHKLHEAPSPHTWRRLERRLDSRRRHRGARSRSFRLVSMAAALLLLAVITFLFSLVLDDRRSNLFAGNDLELEELTYTEVDLSAYQIVEFTRRYTDRMANPIEEGSPDRRLMAASAVRNDLQPESGVPAVAQPEKALLTHFYWLLGEWESSRGDRLSRESWQLQNGNQLTGAGYLLSGTDTLFREELQLRQIDNRLYFILALDQSRQPVQYELVNYRDGRALFENRSVDFPRQVLLTHFPDGRYELKLQNGRPAQMTRSQINFMGHRYELVNQQAVREMRKGQ